MIVMFDTCIILDYLLDRLPYANAAEKLFMKTVEGKLIGYITVKSLTDIHYVLKHSIHDEIKIRNIINTLLDVFVLIDSSADDVIRALSSKTTDYEDALMIQTAASNNADYIVTRSIKDYTLSPVQVLLPDELLQKIN